MYTDELASLRKHLESTRHLGDFEPSDIEQAESGTQTSNMVFEIPPEKATTASKQADVEQDHKLM
jgi:hypothetical protein